jgi:hypothetical protein
VTTVICLLRSHRLSLGAEYWVGRAKVSKFLRFQGFKDLETLKRETLKRSTHPAQAGQSVKADEDDV